MVGKLFHIARTCIDILFLPVILCLSILFGFFKKPINIGLGPLPMINNVYWAEALKKRGYSVETYVNDIYFITDKFDFICNRKNHFIYALFPILLFLRCIRRYECMYIYFDGGPLQVIPLYRRLEPFLLKLAKVRVVVMPYGGDVQVFERTPNKVTVNSLCIDYEKFYRKNHNSIRRQVDRWTRYADIVIGTMDSIDYMYFWNRVIPCPFTIDTDRIKPKEEKREHNDSIKILHAPNHMNIKGTKFIEAAIKRLKEEGYKIDYQRMQRLPNEKVLQAIQEADLVIDQLIMGWYAMFAMEAMASGKPCVCYIREDLIDSFARIGCLNRNDIPFISASTETIYEKLKNLLDNPELLNVFGKKSREYVTKYHSYETIGSFFEEINKSLKINKKGN